jgi:hypothetical protein
MDAGRSWNYDTGETVRVVCYTNGDEAELFLNGKKVGERKPYDPATAIIHWDIPYEPGELKVVAYKQGREVASDAIRTDGEPKAVAAEAKVAALKGKHAVAVIPVTIIDADGRLVYGANHEVTCTISGPGKLLGLENASRDASENLRDNIAACNQGRLVAYVQATADSGTIEVVFSAPGLQPASVRVEIGKL